MLDLEDLSYFRAALRTKPGPVGKPWARPLIIEDPIVKPCDSEARCGFASCMQAIIHLALLLQTFRLSYIWAERKIVSCTCSATLIIL